MRVITLKQPFASLMLFGKIETRSRGTEYRGQVLIAVGKKPFWFKEVEEMSGTKVYNKIYYDILKDVDIERTLGKTLCIGELVDCRKMIQADEAKAFVYYDPEKYVHIYENVVPIVPFSYTGSQAMYKELDETIISKIKTLELWNGRI